VTDRLYRSRTDRVIAGVAGGLATWLNLDPSLVRVAWVLLAIVSGGVFALVYFVMMIVVPLPPAGWTPGPRGSGPATWGAPRGAPGTATGPMSWGAPGEAQATPPPAGDAIPGWGQAGGAWTTPPDGWPASGSHAAGRAPGIVFGLILIVLGAWFLARQYVNIDIDWQLAWPVVIIVLGAAMIVGAMARGRRAG
jgi:phage shock protein PspC (stress-responsive transcriptional regulator)